MDDSVNPLLNYNKFDDNILKLSALVCAIWLDSFFQLFTSCIEYANYYKPQLLWSDVKHSLLVCPIDSLADWFNIGNYNLL